MKARIKATGEIVNVTRNKPGFYVNDNCVGYTFDELDFGNEENEHWQDVRERAAIAAMQGILSNSSTIFTRDSLEVIPQNAILFSDVLITQLKKK